MRHITALLLGILPFTYLYAQLYDNIWLTNRAFLSPDPVESKIEFLSGIQNITSQTGGLTELHTCGTTISDEQGNLLFYTNCYQVANSTSELMENGDSINFNFDIPTQWGRRNGSPISQGAIVLPNPPNPGEYYMVHINTLVSIGTHLLYSKIDMTQDNGLGAVVEKNIIIIDDSIQSGSLSAVKHANGRDWWLIVFRASSKQYYKVLLTPQGFQHEGMGEIDIPVPPVFGPSCFSPDGTKYGMAANEHWGESNTSNLVPRIEVFDFDRCTGTLSNRKRVYYKEPGVDYGQQALGSVSFSPNSRFAYISRWTHVHQIDLNASDLQTSLIKVAEYDGFTFVNFPIGFGYGQIGPDGRIYINDGAPVNNTYHFIEQPNEPCLLSKVAQRGLQLPGMHGWHIPNHPNYRLGPLEGSGCDTLGIGKAIYILAHPYPFEACEGGEAHFEATAFGTGRSYQWQSSSDGGNTWQNLSDGGYFSQTSTEYLLLSNIPASFDGWQFRCIVTGNISTETSRPATLTLIGQVPVAAFDYTQDRDSIHFQSLATGQAYIEWKLGDGDSTILDNPSHLYRQAGTFQAMLIATNACGSDTFSQDIIIPALQANFHADRTHGCAPLTVNFTSDVPYRVSNQKYLTPGSSIPVAWQNDGTHTVTYNSPGVFDVTLMAFTPQAMEKDTLTKTEYITIETGTNPVADIEASQMGDTVQLGTSLGLADSYTWYFSNGDSLSGQNVSYVFGTPGIYEVVLETANHCGAALDTVQFVVGELEAAFAVGETSGCAPLTVQFENTSPFEADSVLWLFPGGSPASASVDNPSVVYATSDTYEATMIAFIAGLADTVTQQFSIEIWRDECPMPQVFTQVNGLEVIAWTDCPGSPGFLWDMGDGSTFATQGIAYQYNTTGVYNISLTVTGQCGGIVTATATVSVTGPSATGEKVQPPGPFNVFPNPASGQVFFSSLSPVSGTVRIRLLSATGMPIAELKKGQWNGTAVLPLDNVPSGLYFYEIRVDGQGLQQGKLVVVR